MQKVQQLTPQFFQSLEIVTLLGSGHDAKVLLAKNNKGEKFALKCQAQKIQETAINLFNEVQILISMNEHPNIVHLIGFSQDYTCLVFEYCPNGTLSKIIQKSPLPVFIASTVLFQISLALIHMHSLGFTHGDLKLSNILIDENYKLKLCDFGFSRWNSKFAIEKQTVAGSEGHTAPELWSSNPDYMKCDMFSLTVVFFILITGHPPFESNNPDNNDPWWKLIKNSEWEKYWKQIKSTLDDDCKQFIKIMLSTDPNQRFNAQQVNQWCQNKMVSEDLLLQELKQRLS